MAFFDDLKTRQRLAMAAMGQNEIPLGAMSVPGDLPQPEVPLATQVSVQNMVDQTAPTTPGYDENQEQEMAQVQDGDSSSQSYGSKMSWEYLSPEDLKRKQELQNRLAELEQRNYEVGQAGIDDYAQSLAQYANAPVGTNWSPLSALVADATGVGGNVAQYLQASAPESADQKRKNLMAMKEQLQGMKGSLSKDQLAYLKEQLKSYEDMMKFEIGENRADKRAAMDLARLAATQGRFDERQVQALAKATESRATLNAAVEELNNALGFDVDSYDTKTGTVGGKKVDIPGASVPGLGRVAFYSERAREVEDTMSRIFNIELKDRSGAAVTSQELTRLKNEFSSGRFQTEKEKIKAVQRYKKLLLEQLNRQESAFSKKVRETYKERIADPSSKLSIEDNSSGLSPEEEAELRQLEAEGY